MSAQYHEQQLIILDTTQSINISSGAVIIEGGLGVMKNLNIGGNTVIDGSLTAGSFFVNNLSANAITTSSLISTISSIGTLNISSYTASSGFVSSLISSVLTTGSLNVTGSSLLNGVVTISNSTGSSNTGSGALVVYGGVGINENINIGGDATIRGNLTVLGTTTTIDTETLLVQDNLIVLNSAPFPGVDGGLLIARATSGSNPTGGPYSYASLYYSEIADEFRLAYTANDPGTTASVTVTEYIPLRAYSATLTSTENALGIGSGGALTVFGGAAISQDLYVGGVFDADNINVTNLTSSNSVLTNLTSSNALLVNVTATNLYVNSITAPNLLITDASITNLVTTNHTSLNSLVTNLTSTSAVIVTGSISNLVNTNQTSTNSLITNLTSTSAVIVTGSISNLVNTNQTSVNSLITNLTSTSAVIDTGSISNLINTNQTSVNSLITNLTSTSAVIATGSISNLINTNQTSLNSVITNGTVSSLNVNTVSFNPSLGDIFTERSATAANNISVPTPVLGFQFSNSTVRAFTAIASVAIDATQDLFANYDLKGLQTSTGNWLLNSTYIGDKTGIRFSMSTAGNILYTSDNPAQAGHVSTVIKFRALTTSV